MAAEGGEGGSAAAGPSRASEAREVPDDFICPITAEIMTDPVSTSDGFTYESAVWDSYAWPSSCAAPRRSGGDSDTAEPG